MAPPAAPIAGLALRPIPKALLQATFSAALNTVLKRHPDILDRLQSIGSATIAIDVTDLPFLLVFRPGSGPEALRLAERRAEAPAAATIRGSLTVLLSLLQGKADGDALFFSRALTIEGDTAIVVALRNVIDNAEIDLLEDITIGFGRLAPVARNIGRFSARAVIGLSRPLQVLQAAINKPIAQELLALRSAIEQLQGSASDLCKNRSRVPQAR
jgi:predicted lipid carrier protein YhbT